MTLQALRHVAVTAALTAAVLSPGVSLTQPASAASTIGIAALAMANMGKGAGNCSTVNSSANSLGGSEFDGSCTGHNGGAEYWCADFVKWVWQNALSGTIKIDGLNAAAASFYGYGSNNGTLHISASYPPQVGDAIVYGQNYDLKGDAQHVGLVTAVNSNGSITTINGDWNGSGYEMVKFAESSDVETTTLQPNEVAVGSTPSSMNMKISAYVSPATTTPPPTTTPPSTPICSPAALNTALVATNSQLNSYSWKLKSYACGSGWAVAQIYAPAVGYGTAFLQQTASGWKSDALGEVNCSAIPGPLATPLPPSALVASLLGKAGICATASASMPDLYLHTAFTFGLYRYPHEPASIGIDNTDFITGLHWATGSQGNLEATGTLHYDNCKPDCASGSYITYQIQILASAPQQCPVKLQMNSSQAVPEYVYNTVDIVAVTGSPPSYLLGSKPLSPACGGGFT